MPTFANLKRIALAVALLALPASPTLAAKTSIVMGMAVEPTGLDPTIAAPVAFAPLAVAGMLAGPWSSLMVPTPAAWTPLRPGSL